MIRLTDKELENELLAAKNYLNSVLRYGQPKVISQAEIQVGVLEELTLWRENGKRWLQYMNSKSSSLSDDMFAGRNDGSSERKQTGKISG